MTKRLPLLFTTKTCTQCQALKPHIEREGIEVELVDAEEHGYLAGEHDIINVPTIVLHDGTRYVGGQQCMKYVMIDSKVNG